MSVKMLALIVFASFVWVVSNGANADSYPDSPSCFKPYKPYEFRDEFHYQSFLDEVSTYKTCINDFADEQREQAQYHLDAADEAIDKWNNFVRFELN